MNLVPAQLNIRDFNVTGLSLTFNDAEIDGRLYIPEPDKIDIEFEIHKATDRNDFLFEFRLSCNESKISFNVSGVANYVFPDEMPDDVINKFIHDNIKPQIYSNTRGYLLAATQNNPIRILLPVVSFFESYKHSEQ